MQHAFQLQVAEEDLQRHDVPGDARRGKLPAVQPGGVVGQIADRELGNASRAEPLEEPPQIAAVGRHGILRQVAFAGRVGHEGIQPDVGHVAGLGRLRTRRFARCVGHGSFFGSGTVNLERFGAEEQRGRGRRKGSGGDRPATVVWRVSPSPFSPVSPSTCFHPLAIVTMPAMGIVQLSQLTSGQEADFFALLSAKEELTTREGKPYWRVSFRDAAREITIPGVGQLALGGGVQQHWTPGVFYKLRAAYRESNYGPQLEIRRIREVCRRRPGRRLRPDDVPAAIAVRSPADVRRAAGAGAAADRGRAAAEVGGSDPLGQSADAAAAAGGAAQSSCLRGRLAGAHAQRHPHLRLPGRQVCRILLRS